jgi:hypothetical protein
LAALDFDDFLAAFFADFFAAFFLAIRTSMRCDRETVTINAADYAHARGKGSTTFGASCASFLQLIHAHPTASEVSMGGMVQTRSVSSCGSTPGLATRGLWRARLESVADRRNVPTKGLNSGEFGYLCGLLNSGEFSYSGG